MYFKALPKIAYPWQDKKGTFRAVQTPDIFRRVQLDKFFKNRQILVEFWVPDGDQPEHVAYNYYGSMQYHWLVLLANNIVDTKREWPLSHRDLVSYVDDKYGAGNATSTHHYVDSVKTELIVDWDAGKLEGGSIKEVTNFDYENDINDKKKQITLLDKKYLKDIVTQYKKLVR